MNKEEEIITLAQLLHNRYRNEDTYCKDINECKVCNCPSKALAEVLYNAGYRKTFTSDLASDTQKAYKDGYNQGVSDGREDFELIKQRNKLLMLENRIHIKNREAVRQERDKIHENYVAVLKHNAYLRNCLREEKKEGGKEFAEGLKDNVANYLRRTNFDGHTDNSIDFFELCSIIDKTVKEYTE